MPLKVIYLTTSIDDPSFGVRNKILKQIDIMRQNNFEVCIINPHRNTILRKLVSILPFVNLNYNYDDFIYAAKDFDCVYIRYFFCNISLIRALSAVKRHNPNIRITIEIPTFPYRNEKIIIHPFIIKDRLTSVFLKKYVDRIFTFSSDSTIFRIPTINISNGIDTSKIKPRIATFSNDTSINIIVVAYISFWHGIDRIIEGLHKYYCGSGTRKFIVHVVGNGHQNVISQLKKLVLKYKLEQHVLFYGQKRGQDLDEIYNICDLGFDALARHRSGVYYNSSLKGKEYLAKGLPVISGVETELDSYDCGFKYYLRVPSNDSPIDFQEIDLFYNHVYNHKEKKQIVAEISTFCKNNFDMNITFDKVITYFKRIE